MAKSAVAASGFHGAFPGVEKGGELGPIVTVAEVPQYGLATQPREDRAEREDVGQEVTAAGRAGSQRSAQDSDRPRKDLADLVQPAG